MASKLNIKITWSQSHYSILRDRHYNEQQAQWTGVTPVYTSYQSTPYKQGGGRNLALCTDETSVSQVNSAIPETSRFCANNAVCCIPFSVAFDTDLKELFSFHSCLFQMCCTLNNIHHGQLQHTPLKTLLWQENPIRFNFMHSYVQGHTSAYN